MVDTGAEDEVVSPETISAPSCKEKSSGDESPIPNSVGRLRSLSKSTYYESETKTERVSLQYAYKFPWLTDSELKEYQIYTRSCFDLMAIGPITFFITVFYVAHANFQNSLSDGPFFTVGLCFGLAASILFYMVFIFAHGVRSSKLDIAQNTFMKGLSRLIFHSIYLEDVIAILTTMSASSYLYARVLKGQCQLDVTLWSSQRCNPVAMCHSVPIDHVFYVYVFPLLHQLILRGIRIQAVFICWIISTAAIIMSIIQAEAWLELWTVFISLFILCIAYEHERFCRVCFLQSKAVAEAEEQKRKRMVRHQMMEHDLSERNMVIERNNHEMEILSIRSDEEKKRMVTEHAQMVSLIGNVAHDLKSVGIDLESLKAKLVAVNSLLQQWFSHSHSVSKKAMPKTPTPKDSPGGLPQVISPLPRIDSDKCPDCCSTEHKKGGGSECIDPSPNPAESDKTIDLYEEGDQASRETDILSLIVDLKEGVTSVDYSCTFMKSAINRSLDFTKATKNIALSPSVSPFNIRDTLTWPLKCVTSMQADVTVTMAPIDPELSEVIISDKHWLIENALCLLSNAVKYSSEGGTVKLTTDLVRMTQKDNEDEVQIRPVVYRRLFGTSKSEVGSEFGSPDSRSATSTPVFACASVKFSHQALVKAVAMAKMKERAISVQLAAALEEGVQLMIRVTVEDTGIGIPDDVKRNLFQPYAQAQRFAGGTGLGLYSLAKRIDALEGKYGVKDRDDGLLGTVFWFAFPYRPDFTNSPTSPFNELASESDSLSGQPSARKTDNKKGYAELATAALNASHPVTCGSRVLIVDDSMTILRVTSRALTNAGFLVDTARNGFIGLNKMLATTFPDTSNLPTLIPTAALAPVATQDKQLIMIVKTGEHEHTDDLTTAELGQEETKLESIVRSIEELDSTRSSKDLSYETKHDYEASTMKVPEVLLGAPTMTESGEIHATLRADPFDFILMDIQMPVMDGIEATLRLRARENAHHPQGSDTPNPANPLIIIGMSANSDSETRRLAHEAGMQYFLPKPFTIAEFRALLETIRAPEA